MSHLEYNTQKRRLEIPEYGRNIQTMVDYCLGVENKEERTVVAQGIVKVMEQVFPQLKEYDDFEHKLWDHLHIMCDFKLDVDSPYPKPSAEELAEKPAKMPYPQGKIRFGHYGKILQNFIEAAVKMEDGEEKTELCVAIANMMKRFFLQWNQKNLNDEVIEKDFKILTDGRLTFPGLDKLKSANEFKIFDKVAPRRKPHAGGRNQHKGRKKY